MTDCWYDGVKAENDVSRPYEFMCREMKLFL
jgi:hypothetical protein